LSIASKNEIFNMIEQIDVILTALQNLRRREIEKLEMIEAENPTQFIKR
jgi:predicted glycosyltransferase